MKQALQYIKNLDRQFWRDLRELAGILLSALAILAFIWGALLLVGA